MPDGMKLTQTRIRGGVWEGVLTGAGGTPPKLDVLHLERPLPGVLVTAVPGREGDFAVKVPIPAEVLSEGVQTLLIRHGSETLETVFVSWFQGGEVFRSGVTWKRGAGLCAQATALAMTRCTLAS